MFNYIVEILVCQALFLCLYQLLKSEPLFRINRVYLLFSLILSLVLPLFSFSDILPSQVSQTYVEWLQPLQLGGVNIEPGKPLSQAEVTQDYQWNTYAVVYGIGLLLYLLWFTFRNRQLFKYLNHNSFEHYKFKPVVMVPKSRLAFSFLHRIYLGTEIPESQHQIILEHEYQHLKQKHSWDMMFIEVLQFLMWFNPLIYIYKNQLRQIHEFEADHSVTQSHSKATYLNTLLNQSFGSQNVSFVNTFFNSSNLKNRIKMLQSTQTSNLKKAKYLLILPVMALAILFSCSQDEIVQPELTDEEIKTEMMSFSNKLFKEDSNVFDVLEAKPNLKEYLENYDLEFKDNYSNLQTKKIGMLLYFLDVSNKIKNDKPYYKSMINDINNHKAIKRAYELFQQEGDIAGEYKEETEVEELEGISDIPFSLIDKPPHPNTCNNLNGEDLKKCTSEFISKHVNNNFNTLKFNGLEPKRYRVSVQFKIDKDGKIKDINARGPSPELETEAINSIKSLPEFIPGEVDGQPVGVLYGLPINFIVAE